MTASANYSDILISALDCRHFERAPSRIIRYSGLCSQDRWKARAGQTPQEELSTVFNIRESVGDDENAGCCQQRIDNARQPVIPAIEALIGEQPSVRVLDDAANGAQPGAVRLAPLADERQDALGRAKP